MVLKALKDRDTGLLTVEGSGATVPKCWQLPVQQHDSQFGCSAGND
jgi:hypothetical protein